MEELAGRGIDGERDVVALPVAGRADRLDDELQRVLVGRETRREAALVAHARGQLPFLEHRFQRVVHLGRRAQRLAVRGCADRAHHELLQVDRRVRVDAAVEDVRERQRQQVRLCAAQVAVQRNLHRVGGRMRRGERDAEDRVGAEARLVGGAIELDQGRVERGLVGDVGAHDLRGDLVEDVVDRLLHALAAVPRRIAVPQLQRLVLAGRRS